MTSDLTYSCPIGRFLLEVERNASGLNESRVVVLRGNPSRNVMVRLTLEELRDLHYVSGRAIAIAEAEQELK